MQDAAIAFFGISVFLTGLFLLGGLYEYVLCPLAEKVKEIIEYVLYVQTR
jgi:hypothetical protein